jgi:hypothetical protein
MEKNSHGIDCWEEEPLLSSAQEFKFLLKE